jgi:hypothetical protein
MLLHDIVFLRLLYVKKVRKLMCFEFILSKIPKPAPAGTLVRRVERTFGEIRIGHYSTATQKGQNRTRILVRRPETNREEKRGRG